MKVAGDYILAEPLPLAKSILIDPNAEGRINTVSRIVAVGDGPLVSQCKSLKKGVLVNVLPEQSIPKLILPDGRLVVRLTLYDIICVFQDGEYEKMAVDKELSETGKQILAA